MAGSTPIITSPLNKKITPPWKIWLGLGLAVISGAALGIGILIARKALPLIVSAIGWFAPFFLAAFLGAVLLAQVVAIILLFRANLDKKMRQKLLIFGVYALPVFTPFLSLALASAAFGATAALPLLWAALTGLGVGLIVGTVVYYGLRKAEHAANKSALLPIIPAIPGPFSTSSSQSVTPTPTMRPKVPRAADSRATTRSPSTAITMDAAIS